MRGQPFQFKFMDSALAEAGQVPLDALHRDVDAICRAYDAIKPVARRLGVEPPQPRLAGFSYCHLSALGAEVVFIENSEPTVRPLLSSPEAIDTLEEPEDYVHSGIGAERLRTAARLKARCPHASDYIGAHPEGPVTTAALILGPDFFLLPYTDPPRARRLLQFCVESGLHYVEAVNRFRNIPSQPGPVGIADDFAGMFNPDLFAEYVLPAWDRYYRERHATRRYLHSELLRPCHLPFLAELDIAQFDPSADQYLTPEILRDQCPVPFTCRIMSWTIENHSPAQLQDIYRRIRDCGPARIAFEMTFLAQEEKIHALLDIARALA